MQLAKCWRSVHERLADESSTPSGELAETIDDSLNRAAREGFLSTNELLDEMSTASLPCVLLPYFKGAFWGVRRAVASAFLKLRQRKS
eukprot:scaffold2908_cov257-Pinguiococcus_pyrenoidosus.AAC.7